MLTKINEVNIYEDKINKSAYNKEFFYGKTWRFSEDWDLRISMNLLKTGIPAFTKM